MSKKRIISIVMLVVLAVGIAMAAYGVTGRNIYVNAAAMMGSDQKSANTFIQDRYCIDHSPRGRINDNNDILSECPEKEDQIGKPERFLPGRPDDANIRKRYIEA
jgi:hypothetical protein